MTASFTEFNYRKYIKQTAERYPCMGFEVLDGSQLPESFALLRHDIDMSPDRALNLAKIESEIGVRSTYTVLLTGEFYSPFELRTRDILKQIARLGHDIGLHFDAAWHGVSSEDELAGGISQEAAMLNTLLGLTPERQVRMFSFHNTTRFTMSCKASHYAGLRNAYAAVLQEKVEYTSDSNGYWIHRSWDQLLAERHQWIQVLTHPEWWFEGDCEPAEKVCRELRDRAVRCWQQYCQLLKNGNRVNKTGLGTAALRLCELSDQYSDKAIILWLSGNKAEAFIILFNQLERLVLALAAHLGITIGTPLKVEHLLALATKIGVSFESLFGYPPEQHERLDELRRDIMFCRLAGTSIEITAAFNDLCHAVASLHTWDSSYNAAIVDRSPGSY